MPQIRPFKAVRYNKEKIKTLSSVVAPPYDVISKKKQDELYAASPYNFVRVELNKVTPNDNRGDNRYARSKALFEKWLKDEILVREASGAVYIYAQVYKRNGRNVCQMGFIALMGLGEEGPTKVLPHENTLAAPKEDRLELIRVVKANLSPIFVLYEDRSHAVTAMLRRFSSKNKPVIEVTFEGVRHMVWKLEEPAAVNKIQSVMRNKDIFIADGHHRYEVSRMYHREASLSDEPESLKKSSGYIMVYFVEMDERMLTVLPAHRLIKDAGGLKNEEALARLKKYFHIDKSKGLKALLAKLARASQKYHVYGLYLGKGLYYTLRLKDEKESDRAIKNKPKPWKRLDVSILHLFVLGHVLGISDADDNVEFLKSAEDSARAVDSGKFGMAFFLNPTKISEVKKIARIGERMPRKATYFYPKPLSGLVVNKF